MCVHEFVLTAMLDWGNSVCPQRCAEFPLDWDVFRLCPRQQDRKGKLYQSWELDDTQEVSSHVIIRQMFYTLKYIIK